MLESMTCLEEHWVRLTTYLLEGDADQWWKVVRQLKFSKSVTVKIKWKDFEAVFYEKYFLDHVQDIFDREFWTL